MGIDAFCSGWSFILLCSKQQQWSDFGAVVQTRRKAQGCGFSAVALQEVFYAMRDSDRQFSRCVVCFCQTPGRLPSSPSGSARLRRTVATAAVTAAVGGTRHVFSVGVYSVPSNRIGIIQVQCPKSAGFLNVKMTRNGSEQ